MIRGSMVALITPFNEDGSVNYKRLRELIDWHGDQQTDAILVLGTTAETPTLTVSEEDEIARISIEQAKGRVPIIVGSGSNNTMVAIEQSLKYEKMGADGLLVITPYYNKASKQHRILHRTLACRAACRRRRAAHRHTVLQQGQQSRHGKPLHAGGRCGPYTGLCL